MQKDSSNLKADTESFYFFLIFFFMDPAITTQVKGIKREDLIVAFTFCFCSTGYPCITIQLEITNRHLQTGRTANGLCTEGSASFSVARQGIC